MSDIERSYCISVCYDEVLKFQIKLSIAIICAIIFKALIGRSKFLFDPLK